ncbi:mitochondrial metalloendopeptidase OMA1-like [Miscanthus floridulus]|uniref:mitochondrial metalloendopeptidase OMA1-like n=1 Tax=Miscanthus floridulus TaxID=154761 RepID=UPI003459D9E4
MATLHCAACSPRPACSLLPPPPIWRAAAATTKPTSRRGGLADGGIFVYTGIIRYMQKDAHIATVLGYEIGHVTAGHVWEGVRNRYWVGVLVNMAADLLELPRDILAQDKWESIFMQPCPFRQEYEADHLGLLLLLGEPMWNMG